MPVGYGPGRAYPGCKGYRWVFRKSCNLESYPGLSKRAIYGDLDRALVSCSDAPLELTLFGGFAFAALAGICLVVVLAQKIMGWHVPGWPASMATILLLGGR